MGDWLGTGNVPNRLKRFRLFKVAREFARSLGLRSAKEWMMFSQGKLPGKEPRPADIPSEPQSTYSDDGWQGWGDWLGTGNVASSLRKYRSFQKARAFARGLGLKGESEWRDFCKGNLPEKGTLPSDIPANPYNTYADQGWAGVGDWLGTGNVANFQREYRAFKDARAFVRNLGLKSGAEWKKFCKGNLPEKGTLPSDIPAAPQGTYADEGWAGVGDWLGTGNVAPRLRKYRAFKLARAFARSLNLRSGAEWNEFCKGNLPDKGTRPSDIPTNPNTTYADQGWAGMGDWLGTGNVANQQRQYRPFNEARAFARSLGLKSVVEWNNYCRGKLAAKGVRPTDIPTNPYSLYSSKGWDGWGDWLGTGNISNRKRHFLPFKEARAFARGLGLKGWAEWNEFRNGKPAGKGTLPLNIPANPCGTYANKGWVGVGDWLGTGRTYQTHRKEK